MKISKRSWAVLTAVLALALAMAFAACGGTTEYAFTFDYNHSGAEDTVVIVEAGDSVAEPDAPVRDGYRFDGWFTTASGETPYDFSGAVNADTTVYAGWTQVYVVTLDANYDEGEDVVREVVAGDAMDTPEAPVRAGYAFKGWFTDATGGAQYNFNAAPTRDMTLYAHWAEAYAITLDYNYDGAPADGTYYAEKDVASVGPQDPVREGYAFNGWYSDAACTRAFSFARPITSATTIYAGWKAQLVMEAEYVDFTGLSGPGYSGKASGTDMIGWDRSGALAASNEYYVSYLYDDGITLTFDFTSSAATNDADIVIRISAEFYDQTFSSGNYTVQLNGSPIPWNAVSIKGSENPAFTDVEVGTQLALKAGENTIELITSNTTAIGGTMKASAPMVDCVKVASAATLTWEPKTSNIE